MNSGENQKSGNDRFEFGRNWQHFIDTQLSPERVESSRRNLLQLLNVADLQGKTFLDVGSGSGLHSLAAWQSGAAHVTSFDYDPQSVETTRRLHALAGSPDNWTIMRGDVLDTEFLSTLSPHDFVYSWGVLHHTGAMWEALRNASQLMNPQGTLCVALYTSEACISPSTDFWLAVKQRYNRAGTLERAAWEGWYFCRMIALPDLLRLRNPFRRFRDYYKSRGMSLWTDIRDWLGGWPMEFAGIMETRAFCRDQLGLKLVWMSAGEACTEYVLRRPLNTHPWGQEAGEIQQIPLKGPFQKLRKRAFQSPLPDLPAIEAGNPSRPYSSWELWEDEEPLTFPRANVRAIDMLGGGLYRIRKQKLYFSPSDNSDPNANGRNYSLRRRLGPPPSPPLRPIFLPSPAQAN